MNNNTWGAFKKAVEAQGVTDETPLAWIDCGCFADDVTVRFDSEGDAEIS